MDIEFIGYVIKLVIIILEAEPKNSISVYKKYKNKQRYTMKMN